MKKYLNLRKVATIVACLAVTTFGAQAQITWNGTVFYSTTQTITQNVNVSGASTVNISPSVTVTISGVISGSAAITVGGGGKLILTAANTYSGAITITGSTVQIGNGTSGSFANVASVTLANSAILRFEPGANMTFDKFIVGAGNVECKNAPGKTLYLTANNAYTGTTTIEAGSHFCIGNNTTTGGVIGDIINNGTLYFYRSDDYTYTGIISGTGNVWAYGTKTILTRASTYTGSTSISNDHILQIGNGTISGNLLNTSGVDIGNGATLRFEPGTDMTFSKVISGNGGVTKGSAGSLIMTGDNTYNGTTSVSQGTLQLGDGTTSGNLLNTSGVDISSGAALRFEPGTNMTFSKVISGSGKVEYKGSYNKYLYFTANNTYTGTTTVESGRLYIGNNTTTGSIAGNIVNNGGIYFQRSNDYTYSGIISGDGFLDKYGAGKLTLNGVHTFTGNTYINQGTLVLGTSGSLENSCIINYANAKFDISAGNKTIKCLSGGGEVILGANTLTIGHTGQNDGWGGNWGIFSGTGNVIKQGTGEFWLSNDNSPTNTATGTFTLKEGFLGIKGRNWAGNLTQNAGTVLEIYDNSTVGGNLTLNGGTVKMDLTQGQTPKLTVSGGVSTSGTTTIKIKADAAINNYVLLQAASGIANITPYTLDMPYMTGSLSVQNPTKLLLNGQIVPRCEIVGGGQYNTINAALNAITTNAPTTIKLLDNITTDEETQFDNKKITFNLNGKNLIFGYYTYLWGNSVVDYTGTGNFKSIVNIQTTDNSSGFYTVDVEEGSTLKLMSVDLTFSGGTNNWVRGIYCDGASTVIVNGDVKVTYSGNEAYGIEVYDNSTITVNGSVTAADYGIFAGNNGSGTTTVTVSGNVNAANGYGVKAYNNAAITIDGKINAANYINLNDNDYAAAAGITDPAKPGYLKYADGATIVWVGNKTTAVETITADELQIYPNPVKEVLRIVGDVPFDNLPFTIYNLAGSQIVNGQWLNGQSINVSHLASGIYFLKLETDEGIITKKIIKN